MNLNSEYRIEIFIWNYLFFSVNLKSSHGERFTGETCRQDHPRRLGR